MRAILIPADTTAAVEEISIETYEDLNAAVGGFIQVLYYPGREDTVAYINEEGKLQGLPINPRATALMMTPEMGYLDGDYVAGALVLIGANLATGEDVDLPADITTKLVGGGG